jgi:hypothetical protein
LLVWERQWIVCHGVGDYAWLMVGDAVTSVWLDVGGMSKYSPGIPHMLSTTCPTPHDHIHMCSEAHVPRSVEDVKIIIYRADLRCSKQHANMDDVTSLMWYMVVLTFKNLNILLGLHLGLLLLCGKGLGV